MLLIWVNAVVGSKMKLFRKAQLQCFWIMLVVYGYTKEDVLRGILLFLCFVWFQENRAISWICHVVKVVLGHCFQLGQFVANVSWVQFHTLCLLHWVAQSNHTRAGKGCIFTHPSQPPVGLQALLKLESVAIGHSFSHCFCFLSVSLTTSSFLSLRLFSLFSHFLSLPSSLSLSFKLLHTLNQLPCLWRA